MSPTTDVTSAPRRRRSTRTAPRTDRTAWTCPNCQQETRPPRKRCADCGTSRY